jgi:dihydrofolate reductase
MMKGGTEGRFVTDGIHAALEQARNAAGGRDIRLGGGVSTIRQYLRAALVDELHLAIAPVLLGTGEHLLSEIDLGALGYARVEHVAGARAAAQAQAGLTPLPPSSNHLVGHLPDVAVLASQPSPCWPQKR